MSDGYLGAMTFPQPIINLVSTRCVDGNHFRLQRWYADHVHLLMAAPEMQHVELYRCTLPLAGQSPDYLCMYQFASLEGFAAFEKGEPRAKASALTNAALGRSSIEILQRNQYARYLHRQWPAIASSGSSTWRLAASLQSASNWTMETERWLSDQLEALRACTPLIAAQALVQHSQASQCFITLDFAGGDAPIVWQLLQDQLCENTLYGQAPESLRFDWAARAAWHLTWQR
jgi:hypothetical protein